MGRYLITQTLIGSWLYQYQAADELWEEAHSDFFSTLRRERREPTEAMQKGIEFETEVYKIVRGMPRSIHPFWESGIQAVATALRGAQTQVTASRIIPLDGEEYLVYGILDALRAGVIYDVKFSTKAFKDADLAGKYLESPQHPAYFYCVPEAYEFRYLVSDGSDLYVETYTPAETPDFSNILREFIAGLKSDHLWEIYTENWKARY